MFDSKTISGMHKKVLSLAEQMKLADSEYEPSPDSVKAKTNILSGIHALKELKVNACPVPDVKLDPER